MQKENRPISVKDEKSKKGFKNKRSPYLEHQIKKNRRNFIVKKKKKRVKKSKMKKKQPKIENQVKTRTEEFKEHDDEQRKLLEKMGSKKVKKYLYMMINQRKENLNEFIRENKKLETKLKHI